MRGVESTGEDCIEKGDEPLTGRRRCCTMVLQSGNIPAVVMELLQNASAQVATAGGLFHQRFRAKTAITRLAIEIRIANNSTFVIPITSRLFGGSASGTIVQHRNYTIPDGPPSILLFFDSTLTRLISRFFA